MEFLDNCTDASETNVGSTGVLCWFCLLWVCCTGEYNFPIVGSTGDSKLSLFWSFRLGFLHGLFNFCPLDRRGFRALPWDPRGAVSRSSGLTTPIFSLSSLKPKSLRIVILTIILVQVLCCLYQSPKHYIEIWHERSFSLQRCWCICETMYRGPSRGLCIESIYPTLLGFGGIQDNYSLQ